MILSRGHPPKCALCSLDERDALVVDHLARDGASDRRIGRFGERLYRWIVRNPERARQSLQLICANCNTTRERRHYRGERVYQDSMPQANYVMPLFLHDSLAIRERLLVLANLSSWKVRVWAQHPHMFWDAIGVDTLDFYPLGGYEGWEAIDRLIARTFAEIDGIVSKATDAHWDALQALGGSPVPSGCDCDTCHGFIARMHREAKRLRDHEEAMLAQVRALEPGVRISSGAD